MHILAFIVALVAVVLFLADYARTKAWIPLGLALAVIAWMIQVVVITGSKVTID